MLTLLIAPWMLSGVAAHSYIVRRFFEYRTPDVGDSVVFGLLGPITVVMAVVFILVNRGK